MAPGDVVLDVGANRGAFAAAVAARTGSDVTIHCVEAAAPIFAELAQAFADTPELAATRHELHPLALSDIEHHGTERTFYWFRRFPTDSTYDLDRKLGEFSLYFGKVGRDLEEELAQRAGASGRRLGGSLRAALDWTCRTDNPLGVWLALQVTGMRALRCRFASLDHVLSDHGVGRVDLLKIDVEGAELDVLRGCEAAWPSVRQVAVETDERDGRAREVIALIESRGLRVTSCAPPKIASRGDADQVLVVADRIER